MSNRRIYVYLAILIPIVMIAVTAFSVFYFKRTITDLPKHNFVYAIVKNQNYYDCLYQFTQKVFDYPKKLPYKPSKAIVCKEPALYIYDFKQGTNKRITPEEAKKLDITEPMRQMDLDGYRVSTYCNIGSPMGWWWEGADYYSVCLIQRGYHERLNVVTEPESYFMFIGWILGKK